MKFSKFSPWPSFTKEEADAVRRVLLSNRVNYWTGDEGRKFETEFAKACNVKHAIALANGTVALELALESLGISKQPFANTVLSYKETYTDPALTKIIDSIKHHFQFSPLLLIIEGEYGSGKTTLFRHLSQSEITNIKLLPAQAEAADTLMQIQHKMSFHLEDIGSANHLDDNLKQLTTFDSIPK